MLENNFDDIIALSSVSEGENKIEFKSHQQKIEYFYLMRFFSKSNSYFDYLFNEYNSEPKNEMILELTKISDLFISANKEFEINYTQTVEILMNNFKFIKEDILNFDDFMEFFKKKRKFSIKIIDFVEKTLEYAINIYKTIESKLNDFCDNSREFANNCLILKDFEEVILKLIPNFENKWMINDYFK